MATLVHHHDPFDPTKRAVYTLARPTTVRRLVQKHKGLRRHTSVFRPGGVYGRRRVREFARMTVALHNGVPLSRKAWKRTVVRQGDVVSFVTCPNPQGGGQGGSNPLQILIAFAVIVASIALPPLAIGWAGVAAGSFAAAAITAGVTIGVALVGYGLMALFAPPSAPSGAGQTGFGGATAAASPTYSLQSQGNYARIEQPIPELIGRHRLFPDFVTTPYISYVDNEQFVHHILGITIGEVEIEEDSLKLGETPITSYEDIEWAVIEPGALSDVTIADERWITNTDVADVEMLDSAEASPWVGPFATGSGALIDRIEVDFGAPRGLWAFNTGTGGLDPTGKTVDYDIEAMLIDDLGLPLGGWVDLGSPFTKTGTTQDVLRWSEAITLPESGRWQIRARRTDLKDVTINVGHELHLIGLRARLVGRRTFEGMTCIALKMKASGDLNAAQSRAFNLIATRKLPTWTGTEMDDDTLVATTNPCDALAHIARSMNGGRLADDKIDLEGIYALYDGFDPVYGDPETMGWQFNFVFDSSVTVNEALSRVARAIVAQQVVQGGKLRLVRDVAVTAPVAMFGPRNIAPGSLDIQYMMVDSTVADAVVGSYIDDRIWQPAELTAAFDDSPQELPARVTLYGVTVREQAWAVAWWLARQNRYRRRTLSFQTPMEGLAVLFGDGISFSHDVPRWGQTLEVTAVDGTDPNAPILTVTDQVDFSEGGTYYAAVRDSKGLKAGPFVAEAVAGEDYQLVLTVPDPVDLPAILTGGDRERTWLQLGPGDAYSRPLKVVRVTPRSETTADVIAIDDDSRVYDALPDVPGLDVGVSTDPLEIHIDAPASAVNLRTLASEEGYTGLLAQQVTIYVDAGVEVTNGMVRGSWPVGYDLALVINGTVSGATGAAGNGGLGAVPVPGSSITHDGFPGTAGGIGGTSLNSSTGAITLTGTGVIRGGKGGGGGGGGGGGTLFEFESGQTSVPGGNGGAGNGGAGTSGGTIEDVSSGDGGDGGAEGAWAFAGSSGEEGGDATGGVDPGFGGAGGTGGTGGKAITGIANVDATGFVGTILGTTS